MSGENQRGGVKGGAKGKEYGAVEVGERCNRSRETIEWNDGKSTDWGYSGRTWA